MKTIFGFQVFQVFVVHEALLVAMGNVSESFILALHRPEALVMCHNHLQLPREVAVTPIYVRSDRAAGWGSDESRRNPASSYLE